MCLRLRVVCWFVLGLVIRGAEAQTESWRAAGLGVYGSIASTTWLVMLAARSFSATIRRTTAGSYTHSTTKLFIDNSWDSSHADILFRTGTSGTTLTPLTIRGTGLVGIGTSAIDNALDVSASQRTGSHPSGLATYVTGGLSVESGVRFSHCNGTQGVDVGSLG
jgi:hypothetical protein